MNRGLQRIPKGRGLTIDGLSGTKGTPTYGSQPVYDPRTRTWVMSQGPGVGVSSYVFNLSPTSMPYLRGGKARSLTGGNPLHLCFLGDSTTDGNGLGYRYTFPELMRLILERDGRYGKTRIGWYNFVNATWTPPTVASAYATWDPNVLTWVTMSSTTTWTTGLSDTARLAFYNSAPSGASSFTYAVDGGTAVTVNTNGAAGMGIVTIPLGTVATHTIVLTKTGASAVYMIGGEDYDSTQTYGLKVSISAQAGLSSGATGLMPGSATDSANTGWLGISPDAVFVNLGLNDAVAYNFTRNNLTKIGTVAGQIGADPVLIAPNYITDRGPMFPNELIPATYAAALDLGCPLVDLYGRWTSLPSSVGTLFGSGSHPTKEGYADEAYLMASALRAFE